MSKEEIMQILEKKGYRVSEENGVLIILYNSDKSPYSEIKKIIQENHYKRSFGVKKNINKDKDL